MNKQRIDKLLKSGSEIYLENKPIPEGEGEKARWLRQGYTQAKESINAVVDECQLLTRGYDV